MEELGVDEKGMNAWKQKQKYMDGKKPHPEEEGEVYAVHNSDIDGCRNIYT